MAEKKTELPSEEEIRKLPRWARVAFAARCARRVQPLFKALWHEAPEECCQAVEKAIWIAEDIAGRGTPRASRDAASSYAYAAALAGTATDASTHAYGVARAALRAAAVSAAAARAAGRAARAAADAAVSDAAYAAARAAARAAAVHAAAGVSYDAASYAADAVSDAVHAAADAVHAKACVVSAMWTDFGKLKTAAKKKRWTDETPVPPEFFGPLWPEGEPKGWPSASAEPARRKDAETSSTEERLVVQATVRGSVDDETLVDGITNLYKALNKYHILCGGTGLTIDDWRIFVRSGKPMRELV